MELYDKEKSKKPRSHQVKVVEEISSTTVQRKIALSASRANDFKQCPLMYRLRAIDKIPEPVTQAQIIGTLVHSVFEDLYSLKKEERTISKSLDILKNNFKTIDSSKCNDFNDKKVLERSEKLIKQYFELENPLGFDPLSVEMLVEEYEEDMLLRGYIDRIDISSSGDIRVVDYKTGQAPGAGFETKALFQMKFYALLILKSKKSLPKKLRLIYLSNKQIVEYEPNIQEITLFSKQLKAIWEAILKSGEDGSFMPKPSNLCSWCSFKNYCPEFGGSIPNYPGWPEKNNELTKIELDINKKSV